MMICRMQADGGLIAALATPHPTFRGARVARPRGRTNCAPVVCPNLINWPRRGQIRESPYHTILRLLIMSKEPLPIHSPLTSKPSWGDWFRAESAKNRCRFQTVIPGLPTPPQPPHNLPRLSAAGNPSDGNYGGPRAIRQGRQSTNTLT